MKVPKGTPPIDDVKDENQKKNKKKSTKKTLVEEEKEEKREPETLEPETNVPNNQEEDIDGEDDEINPAVEESDSSEDEVAPRNTIGNVPLKWYEDEDHIGYEITGKKIKKQARKDKLDSFLATVDDSKNWRKIHDEYNDEDVEITKKEIRQIRKLLEGKTPHSEIDPYPPYLDWFKWDDAKHPLSNAPDPKSRYIPSIWEAKKVRQLVRGIRKGHIQFDKPKEESRYYLLWGDDSSSREKGHGLSYIPPPKPKLPGHEESYNPSVEYIPTQEEINSYQLMYEEDRPKFIPRRFDALRKVPAYENAVKESFDRCLDLYLCPRTRKKRINIDPESLKPKLPSRKDLKPYPLTCYLEYKGHMGAVISISIQVSGQWLASGSKDGTVRIWEVETGRCLRIWELGEAVQYVAWNPVPELPILAVAVGQDVLLLNTGLGNAEEQQKVKELLRSEAPSELDNSDHSTSIVSWLQHDKHEGIKLKHLKMVTSVEWHRKGDYFSIVMPAVLIHQLSKKITQKIPFKLHGLPVSSVFHPSRPILFVSTKKSVRVYDLLKEKLIRKLETGVREVSSIAIHPAGSDNVIVGSREGKLCWFDMDLSSQPYRILKCHPKDITNVAFHRSYPLFASCSDDGTAYVFHGMVYSDLNQNPLIVPLEILRGHARTDGRGVMDCTFHPRQPWLFTAGSDSVIKLYCH
ncbi:WD40 repeat [Macleaya cordata]|uniref:Ribosome biogenesis protein BOP1 homolog n=1 Tax=Macleaya cordata TaxID=56857 RepID=A0A200Q1D8_MACCD|nr:WD40 repeat [Macleaya cordata]